MADPSVPVDIVTLASAFVGGRVLLAWLPPGAPGGHALRDLPHTLAASFLFGLACITLALQVLPSDDGLWIWSAVVLVLMGVRLAARPLAMMPRHEPALERASPLARVALACAWLLVFAAVVTRSTADVWRFESLWQSETLIVFSAVVLCDWACCIARGSHWTRAWAAAAFAALLATYPEDSISGAGVRAAFFVAGAASSVAWFQRADRRALILAVVFFAATMLFARGGWALALAGVVSLAVGTPAPSRPRVAVAALAALAVFGAVAWRGTPVWPSEWRGPISPILSALIGLLFLPVVFARWRDSRRTTTPAWNPSGARVGHERAMLSRTVVAALILAFAARALDAEVRADLALLPALFALVLLSGLSVRRLLVQA
ncbi:MAG: hypothetical protein JNL28_16535 [Planctomycetes bacterium]|nr:hypothetical protein [Planctomycetota bacterium]